MKITIQLVLLVVMLGSMALTGCCTLAKSEPRKDHRGVDLISDALPFSWLWYADYRSQAVKLRVTIRLAAS